MRLLHSKTLEFATFYGDATPPYTILSHTWGDEEVTFEDMRFIQKRKSLPEDLRRSPEFMLAFDAAARLLFPPNRDPEKLAGYEKIRKTAEIANRRGHRYFWIDTCCIDKSSSSELQEAINSMYSWYKKSAICIVYLEDVDISFPAGTWELAPGHLTRFAASLKSSRWITRGWTLQELIAPGRLTFYNKDWEPMISKYVAAAAISSATKIPPYVLATGQLHRASVAQKMSWAAKRETTRTEDMAYCLLGLFQVHMPMLYGEGQHAFLRLQHEILQNSDDNTIFAWEPLSSPMLPSIYRGLLARSPEAFSSTSKHQVERSYFTTEAKEGIRVDLEKAPLVLPSGEVYYVAILGSANGTKLSFGDIHHLKQFYMFLKQLDEPNNGRRKQYVRVMGIPNNAQHQVQHNILIFHAETICVRQQPIIPLNFETTEFSRFVLRPDTYSATGLPDIQAMTVWPLGLISEKKEIMIPSHSKDFTALVWLQEHFNSSVSNVQVLLKFTRFPRVGYWCDIITGKQWPKDRDSVDEWRKAIERNHSVKELAQRKRYRIGTRSEIRTVSIEPGIHADQICLFVNIDGLII
ncbi:uncharacterized protein N0V89_011957 [Didymosphaeria variabile]|uniref:Heterokaryon incompatibility domain-containing protein n=1 Tax=Didymosphaeria variabile TaxID=1932322 RepID=A0A9W8XCN9_9PLEO|nr:uncharacterized protein N0V89_011957 [Didymosphaeria variabile]KAJ4345822.1 hypothetical protein N0V89_011957 [Didymosphaeria variabile]